LEKKKPQTLGSLAGLRAQGYALRRADARLTGYRRFARATLTTIFPVSFRPTKKTDWTPQASKREGNPAYKRIK